MPGDVETVGHAMADEAPAPPAPITVHVALDAERVVSHAAERNSIPVVKRVRVANVGPETLAHIQLELSGSSVHDVVIPIDQLSPGEVRGLEPVDLRFHERYLSQLAEEVDGEIAVRVRSASGAVLAAHHYAVRLLAYDQWPGLDAWPGLLAAFSLPNHPVVERIVGRAAVRLAAADPPGAMAGYQLESREEVWRQTAAIYNAVAETGVLYSSPPASFDDGQKIRTPDRIADSRLGTCLDLAMLFSSCLEQAGLNPIVLFKPGHAWVGVWLCDTSLPALANDDLVAMRKRVSGGELLLVEATAVATRPVAPFADAVRLGAQHLFEPEATLDVAIDIAASRRERVRPLATRWTAASAEDDDGPNMGRNAVAPDAIDEAPELPPLAMADLAPAPTENGPAEVRLGLWKSRLLDLTLRNRLLNFQPSRLSVPLFVPDPSVVEDALASGREWRFRSAADLISAADPRSATLAAARTGEMPNLLAQYDWMARRELLVLLPPDAMQARLLDLFRAARTGREEGGANTLYLIIGMLSWSLDGGRGSLAAAPILLVPVTLTRTSVRSHFGLARHDDETLVNPTLLQLLRDRFGVNVPGLDPLPSDDHGVDVSRVLQAVGLAVKDLPGFEVQAYTGIALLSFSKYLMWRDLEKRADDLRQSRVVARILGDAVPISAEKDLDQHGDIDERLDTTSVLAPLPADSTQLNVLTRASAGHDLVIKGPPGTGKSQTITNLIAHCLGQGQTVLFVSEKTAALEVVQRRLDGIGLSPFCLELHSARSNKREVLNQLQAAFDAAAPLSDPGWAEAAEELAAARRQLGGWASLLHRRQANGLSLFDALDTVIAERRRARFQPLPLPWDRPDHLDAAELQRLEILVDQLQARAAEVSHQPGHPHPLRGLAAPSWSSDWARRLSEALSRLTRAAADLEGALQEARDSGWPISTPAPFGELRALARVIQAGAGAAEVPAVLRNPRANIGGALAQAADIGRAASASWEPLAPYFRETVTNLNATELGEAWSKAQRASWWAQWRGERAVRATLRAHAHLGGGASRRQVEDILAALGRCQAAAAALRALEPSIAPMLGPLFQGYATDWDEVARAAAWHQHFAAAMAELAASAPAALAAHAAVWVRDVDRSADPAPLMRAWEHFLEAVGAVEALGGDLDLSASDDAAGGAAHVAQRWAAAQSGWRRWAGWCAVRAEALQSGLDSFVAVAEAGRAHRSDLAAQWAYSYRAWWLQVSLDREPELSGFSRAEQMRRIQRLARLEDRVRARAAMHLRATLAARVPLPAAASRDPAMRTVLRELQKQRQHLPVRVLMERLGDLLPRLKPCLLMSPLSVAQYLDAGTRFDVVIFDEASQIAVWDAVGVLARGRQAIVVGDPKQLPPSQFFTAQASRADEDLTTDTPDLESILDECIAAGVPALSLQWHYRSRHESLIAFSNHHYYDGKLVTFPGPGTDDRAVRLERVAGVYDRGGTRANRAEAVAVVDAIQRHFHDEARSAETVGVVTFNQPQQHLIETLLDQRQSEDPALEAAISRQGVERVFVKNLENVQGDERDIIYFSVTYGRDETGRMAMNFGPLNQAGGPRRLNVAVTRARVEAVVFASIGPDDIDLSRTRSEGVRDLRSYLAHANRAAARAGTLHPSATIPGILEDMRSALARHGLEARPAVGLSDFRVDLAVVDPAQPDRYALAILLDGPDYARLPSVPDRELLRAALLEGLGWKIHRTWAFDWWERSDAERKRIQAAVKSRPPSS